MKITRKQLEKNTSYNHCNQFKKVDIESGPNQVITHRSLSLILLDSFKNISVFLRYIL